MIPRPGFWSKAALVAAALAAAGCASLSESECRAGDWRGIGVADGRDGQPPERLADHREACSKHGVALDEQAWHQGRDEGLRGFCTASNGFRVGSSGAAYAGVCPPLLEGAFLTAFEHGRGLHVLRTAFSEVEQAIAAREGDLRRIEDDVRAAEQAAAAEQDADRRRDLIRTLRRLAEQRGRLRGEIDSLRGEYYARRARLDDYRAALQRIPDYPSWVAD